jgi:hypothetical protein
MARWNKASAVSMGADSGEVITGARGDDASAGAAGTAFSSRLCFLAGTLSPLDEPQRCFHLRAWEDVGVGTAAGGGADADVGALGATGAGVTRARVRGAVFAACFALPPGRGTCAADVIAGRVSAAGAGAGRGVESNDGAAIGTGICAVGDARATRTICSCNPGCALCTARARRALRSALAEITPVLRPCSARTATGCSASTAIGCVGATGRGAEVGIAAGGGVSVSAGAPGAASVGRGLGVGVGTAAGGGVGAGADARGATGAGAPDVVARTLALRRGRTFGRCLRVASAKAEPSDGAAVDVWAATVAVEVLARTLSLVVAEVGASAAAGAADVGAFVRALDAALCAWPAEAMAGAPGRTVAEAMARASVGCWSCWGPIVVVTSSDTMGVGRSGAPSDPTRQTVFWGTSTPPFKLSATNFRYDG